MADFVRWYSPRDWLTDDLDCEKIEELPAEDKTTSTENEWDIVDTDVPRDDNPSNSEGTKVKDEPSDGQAPVSDKKSLFARIGVLICDDVM